MNDEIQKRAAELADSSNHPKVNATLDALRANQGQSQAEIEKRLGTPDSFYGDDLHEQAEMAQDKKKEKETAKETATSEWIKERQQEVADEENFVAEGHQQYRGP